MMMMATRKIIKQPVEINEGDCASHDDGCGYNAMDMDMAFAFIFIFIFISISIYDY